jgi:integrase/recombinase XerC/integrase/recombinase XerD
MKNKATVPQASDAWRAAMRAFDRELQRRGAAERTRRAYGVDLGQLALWSSAHGVEPAAVDQPVLRRYAAQLASRGAGPHSVARKLAAIRSFFTSMVELGEMPASPADLLPAPARPRRLPWTLEADVVAALLHRMPAITPLELRDRAMFELAYACGLRAEELVNLDLDSIDFDAEEVRVRGRGGKTRCVPAGEPVLRAVTRYLERGRPGLAGAEGVPALLLSKSGLRLSTSDVRRRLRVSAQGAANHGQAIRELLGAVSISPTPDYTRIESARLRDAYARSHPRA